MKSELVKDTDNDYRQILWMMQQLGVLAGTTFDLNEAMDFLKELTKDDSLASLIDGSDPSGYAIYKDATSQAGVQAVDLAAFAAFEQRMCNIAEYIRRNYSSPILRERQDAKMRFEVGSKGTRISEIFASIEANKESLMLADYSVSQTSLEQVFNQHAEAAEQVNQGEVEESRRRVQWPRRKLRSFLTSKLDQTEEADSESTSVKDLSNLLGKPTHWDKSRSESRTDSLPVFGQGKASAEDESSDRPWLESKTSEFLSWLEGQVASSVGNGKKAATKAQSSGQQQTLSKAESQEKSSDLARTTSKTDSHTDQFLCWLEAQVAAYKGETKELSQPHSSSDNEIVTSDPEGCFDPSNLKWFTDQSRNRAQRRGDGPSPTGRGQDFPKMAAASNEEIESEEGHLEIEVSTVGLQATSSGDSSMAEGTWTGDEYFV